MTEVGELGEVFADIADFCRINADQRDFSAELGSHHDGNNEPLPDVKTRAYSDDLRGTLDAAFDFTSLDMSTSILLARRRESDLLEIGFPRVQSDDPGDPEYKIE